MSEVTTVAAAHTGITVSDLDRAAAFFRDALGFQVSRPSECTGVVFEKLTGVAGAAMRVARVTAPGHTIELVQYLNPPSRPLAEMRPHDAGTMHLAFTVDDIDRVVAAAAGAGVCAVNPVQTVLEGPRARVRAVYTRDVDGVVIEFIEHTRRGDPPQE
jgi:catechol 2,3-dioxygenase-like lactoylglutathione lyase family enzyme